MVVLDGSGGVVTIGNNQYLQPDYLTPITTSMDAKQSPLALLAQTCSQIGADSSTVKPLLNLDKKKRETTSKSPLSKTPRSNTPIEVKLNFKPYETNVLSHTTTTNNNISINKPEDYSQPPSSKNTISASESVINQSDMKVNLNSITRVPSRSKSNTPEINVTTNSNEQDEKTNLRENRKTTSPTDSPQRGASPIIRSGLEVLQSGHTNDAALNAYKNAYGLSQFPTLCCPPGMEQHSNPAFRPSFAGSFPHHHVAMLTAAAANGYSSAVGNNPNPYIVYQRIKTPSGSEAVVPVCKDPYCPGCPYSAHTQQILMGASCPSGCTQCEHQKYGLSMAASLGTLPSGHPYATSVRSPYVCSWITSDSYCGKRFNTSDELFTHLRTHTGNLSDPAAAAAALAQSQTQSLLSSLFSQTTLPRTYSTSPLSPVTAAARYHPYIKTGTIPPNLSGSPFAAFNPTAAALGPYYSPYAMYCQRINSAAVHP